MNRVELVSRRAFLGGMFSAGALVISARLLPVDTLAAASTDNAAWNPSVYLGIETDGTVMIVNVRTQSPLAGSFQFSQRCVPDPVCQT